MKTFFKSFLASLLAIVVAFSLMGVISFLIIVASTSSMMGDKEETEKVKSNSVLHVKFDVPVVDYANDNPFASFNVGQMSGGDEMSLRSVLGRLERAKTDENIEGIYLDLKGISMGMASMEEVREALLDFKSEGKWIISFADYYSHAAYYMASVSDKVYMYPEGDMTFQGLSSEVMFYKGLAEKLGVEMQVIRGRNNKFKSAVEPFLYDHMSDANKEQVKSYLGGIWSHLLGNIADARGVSVDDLNMYADSLMISDGLAAVDHKLIDGLMYKDEITDALKMRLELEEDEDINYASFSKYKSKKRTVKSKDAKSFIDDRIAIIYAQGEIGMGEGGTHSIGSEGLSKAIRKARKDSAVKAIVLRVNSPGGSALASDIIWREAMLAKDVKPFVVSMGNVAASGGYYIACGADKIYAEPTTITGSIGVFGMMPNLKGVFNDKLGITFDGVKTNAHSDMGTTSRGLSDFEYKKIQMGVEKVYGSFITKVADGRGKTVAEIDSIGQGRVWCGTDALKIGLVDELGGLNAALAYAAEKAEIEDYKILELPRQKSPFKEFMKEFGGTVKSEIVKEQFGSNAKYFETIHSMINAQGVQARLPYDLVIK